MSLTGTIVYVGNCNYGGTWRNAYSDPNPTEEDNGTVLVGYKLGADFGLTEVCRIDGGGVFANPSYVIADPSGTVHPAVLGPAHHANRTRHFSSFLALTNLHHFLNQQQHPPVSSALHHTTTPSDRGITSHALLLLGSTLYVSNENADPVTGVSYVISVAVDKAGGLTVGCTVLYYARALEQTLYILGG